MWKMLRRINLPPLTTWLNALVLICVCAGTLILAMQAFAWLRNGYWTPLYNVDVFSVQGEYPPEFDWGGVQKIWMWLLDQSLGVTLVVIGIAIGWLRSLLKDYFYL